MSQSAEQKVDFGDVFEQYQDPINRYCLRLMGNLQDADECSQETFTRAFSFLGRTDPDLKMRPWLYRIATNCCLDELRKKS